MKTENKNVFTRDELKPLFEAIEYNLNPYVGEYSKSYLEEEKSWIFELWQEYIKIEPNY